MGRGNISIADLINSSGGTIAINTHVGANLGVNNSAAITVQNPGIVESGGGLINFNATTLAGSNTTIDNAGMISSGGGNINLQTTAAANGTATISTETGSTITNASLKTIGGVIQTGANGKIIVDYQALGSIALSTNAPDTVSGGTATITNSGTLAGGSQNITLTTASGPNGNAAIALNSGSTLITNGGSIVLNSDAGVPSGGTTVYSQNGPITLSGELASSLTSSVINSVTDFNYSSPPLRRLRAAISSSAGVPK